MDDHLKLTLDCLLSQAFHPGPWHSAYPSPWVHDWSPRSEEDEGREHRREERRMRREQRKMDKERKERDRDRERRRECELAKMVNDPPPQLLTVPAQPLKSILRTSGGKRRDEAAATPFEEEEYRRTLAETDDERRRHVRRRGHQAEQSFSEDMVRL